MTIRTKEAKTDAVGSQADAVRPAGRRRKRYLAAALHAVLQTYSCAIPRAKEFPLARIWPTSRPSSATPRPCLDALRYDRCCIAERVRKRPGQPAVTLGDASRRTALRDNAADYVNAKLAYVRYTAQPSGRRSRLAASNAKRSACFGRPPAPKMRPTRIEVCRGARSAACLLTPSRPRQWMRAATTAKGYPMPSSRMAKRQAFARQYSKRAGAGWAYRAGSGTRRTRCAGRVAGVQRFADAFDKAGQLDGCSVQIAEPFRSETMQIGMIGLGRMGGNMARRLMKAGHHCVVFGAHAKSREALAKEGATAADSPADLVQALTERPRAVWLMLPAGGSPKRRSKVSAACWSRTTSSSTAEIPSTKTISAAPRQLAGKRIHYVDCGTSGGVWGIERGYCMMIGGPKEAVDRLDPIFAALAPGMGEIPRTPGRDERRSPRRARVHSCRPVRRRALRQDGA